MAEPLSIALSVAAGLSLAAAAGFRAFVPLLAAGLAIHFGWLEPARGFDWLGEPLVLVGPCDRPNLTYRVQPRVELLRQVLGVIERHRDAQGRAEAGIVYCISRKDVERLDAYLREAGVRSVAYHAGLEPDVRRRAQEAFLNEEVDVVVATVAFGMGIDRTDVRFVVHAALPKGV